MQLVHALHQPKGQGPHPTILALHGWGANAMDLLGLAPYICNGRFLMICPQGPLEVPIGVGAVGYGWFPLSLNRPADLKTILSAGEKLKSFLDECLARYPIDPGKLVALGFSQGGVMAYSLALGEPERFGAVTVLSSWVTEDLVSVFTAGSKRENPPVLIQHGSRDDLVPVERARDSVEVLRKLRIPVTYREYDMGHEISPLSLADLSNWLQEKIFSSIIVPA